MIFSWLTNASFAAAVKGHVLLLDTFVTRLEVQPGRTPLVIQDLVDLDPDYIFIGHGHFDHADNAAYIAQQTGAVIFASPETCDNMAIDALNNYNNRYTVVKTVTCRPLTSRGSLPGAEIVAIYHLEPEVNVSVFKHLHSTNTGITDAHACADRCKLRWGMSAHADKRQHVPVQSAGPARSAAISSRHAVIGRHAISVPAAQAQAVLSRCSTCSQ